MSISPSTTMNASASPSPGSSCHAASLHARAGASPFGQADQGPCLLLGTVA